MTRAAYVLMAVLAGLLAVQVALRLAMALMRRRLRRLEESCRFIRDRLREARRLQVRIESYPEEVEAEVKKSVPFQEAVSREVMLMNEAASYGDRERAGVHWVRANVAAEQAEAVLARASELIDEWDRDGERLERLIKEARDA